MPRRLTVYLLGGPICGANWLTALPKEDTEAALAKLFQTLTAEFRFEVIQGSLKELPISADLKLLAARLAQAQDNGSEFLVLMDLTRMLQVGSFLEHERASRFPDAVITLVGTPLLLGAPEPMGDPQGAQAKLALSNALAGPRPNAGIYCADALGRHPLSDTKVNVFLSSATKV